MCEITTTKEAVLKAAKTSTEAEKALRALFPDAFEESIHEVMKKRTSYHQKLSDYTYSFEVRKQGTLANKGFYLSYVFDWRIAKDNEGALVLIPSIKP